MYKHIYRQSIYRMKIVYIYTLFNQGNKSKLEDESEKEQRKQSIHIYSANN